MAEASPKRVAMWSGPRNISTAMMRSWGSRPDTFVTDEPLYAHYLLVTGREHPGREEVIDRYETDWRAVAEWLTGPVPSGKAIWFQKHMAHHLLPEIDHEWVAELANCFLIRHPRDVITSYAKVIESPTADDLGFPQQTTLFEYVTEATGREPPVIDARRVLEDPAGLLERLCETIGVPYTDAMLRWEPGLRETDGIWAEHWYANVARSTGFAPYRPKGEEVPERLMPVYEECMAHYESMLARSL